MKKGFEVFFVIDDEGHVVGMFDNEQEADAQGIVLDSDKTVRVTDADIRNGLAELDFAEANSPIEPLDVLEEHATEIEELFQRLGAVEVEIFGEERPLLEVIFTPEDKRNVPN